MQDKLDRLKRLYASFDMETAGYRDPAACVKGCAFCCAEAGSIDITTLEGINIRRRITKMPRPRQTSVLKALKRDLKKRQSGQVATCPFLTKTKACMIYDDRPLACRRIYSLRTCSRDNPPLLSRQVMDAARDTITALQRLDENGYSGHLSYVLHLLDNDRFLATYRAGHFKPEEIMDFGRAHKISINKMVCGQRG